MKAVDNLRAMYGQDTPLALTGHSLGAALAMIASLDLYLDGYEQVQEVYNFGQPRFVHCLC